MAISEAVQTAVPILKTLAAVVNPSYSEPEQEYYTRVVARILDAKMKRDTPNDAFDGQGYLQRCESNRKLGNTYIEPKRNRTDNNFSAGTIRSKLLAYLAAVINLDLSPDLEALNEHFQTVANLGEAMEDILSEADERDGEGGNIEQQIRRFYTMLLQGEVFVRDSWEEKWEPEKRMQKAFDGKVTNPQEWTSKLAKV